MIDDFLRQSKGIMPTAILVGIRDSKVRFEPFRGSAGHRGMLHVADDATLYVVDGQHRIEGLRSAQRTGPKSKELAKFGFPVVFLCPTIWKKGINAEIEEGKQFIIVNKTQTGVKGDLVNAFVYSLSVTALGEPKPDLSGLPADMERFIQPIRAVRNITLIIQYNVAWMNRINKPNEPRGKNVIGEKTMMDALLLYVLDKPQYTNGGGSLAVGLGQYWQAIMTFYPNALARPKEYWVQKGLGVAVFTKIFPEVDKLAETKDLGGYLAVLQNKAKMPPEVFWSRNGPARTMGTSYGARDALASQIWP